METENIPDLIDKKERIVGQKYLYKDRIVIWNGHHLKCEHNKDKNKCEKCIAEVNKKLEELVEQEDVSDVLDLPVVKNRIVGQKYLLNTEIVIWTGKRLHCKHNLRKSRCVECGGDSICIHGMNKEYCIECEGSQICIHKKEKRFCKDCDGSGFCEHNTRRRICKHCNFNGYLTGLLRHRVKQALKVKNNYKEEHTMDYVSCDLKFLREYIEKQFDENMNWDNQGDYWHLDHIKPCASFDLSKKDEIKKCFHYSNIQPMEGKENQIKSCKYNEETFNRYWKNDIEGWVEKK